MVLKVTSILSRQQRDIAEKEAKLLSRLSHPSIIKMFDTCYRTVNHSGSSRRGKNDDKQKERPQHLILMEYCEGGHALDVCSKLVANGSRFDLSTLIIAFGQICNAVSYLHAQRPPIVHRDLKPANFLVKNGAYKLCDFGSAVFGHVELKTTKARSEAEEVIQKTTTQMFRAPEMVDLFMAKKLTQATDVWALGCCLYSMAFLQNCFEEGSNLAILSRKYKIPDDNPYGEGMVELLDRMLTIDSKARADMTEVILCLSAVYSNRPLPPRKERQSKSKDKESKDKEPKEKEKKKKSERTGTYRTDGQGIYGEDLEIAQEILKAPPTTVAKKLDPNSAAARRRAAAGDLEFASFHSKFDEVAASQGKTINPDQAFSLDNPFAAFDGDKNESIENNTSADIFASFDESADLSDDVLVAFGGSQQWGNNSAKFEAFHTFSPDSAEAQVTKGNYDRSGEDEGDEEGENQDGEKGQSPRRRRSGSRRTRTADGTSDPDSTGDSADGDEGGDGGKRRPLRRTRSGSRRTLRTGVVSKDESEGEDNGEVEGVEHGVEEKDSKTRSPKSSSSSKSRRSEGRSTEAGSTSSSRRTTSTRDPSGRSSKREKEASRPRTMSAGGD